MAAQKKKVVVLAYKSANCKRPKKKVCDSPCWQEDKLWTTKSIVNVYSIELCDDLILLEIVSFHGDIGSLVNIIAKSSLNKTKKGANNKTCLVW